MKLYKEASLMMLPTSVKDGKLYSIFPQPKVISGELVTNGDFEDGLNGWVEHLGNPVVSNGVVHFTGDLIKQSILTIDKTYKVTVNVTEVNSGLGKIQLGATIVTFSGLVEEQTFYVTATDNADFYVGRNSSTDDFKIDNVSVVEVDQVPADFDFSRGSNLAATRINEQGLIEKGRENLLLQSNNFDTTWTIDNYARLYTPTSGILGYDGTNDGWLLDILGDTTSQNIKQSLSSSGVQTFSVYAKANTLGWMLLYVSAGTLTRGYFDIANGTLGSSNNLINSKITDAGNGWYRCSITFNEAITSARVYLANANNSLQQSSGSIYIQDAQLEVGLVATDYIESGATTGKAGVLEDLPRLDWSGDCPVLLLEPQRINKVLNSEYREGSDADDYRITTTSNAAISPDGLQNATLFTENTDSNTHFHSIGNITWVSGTTYTVSAYVKSNGRDLYLGVGNASVINFNTAYDLTNGVVLSSYASASSIEDVGNGWWRITATATAALSLGTNILPYLYNNTTNYTGDGTSGIYVYGFQAEEGSYATSYIPTHGTSVTRSGDACFLQNADVYSSGEGTIFFEVGDYNTNTSASGFNKILVFDEVATSSLDNIIYFEEYAGDNTILIRKGGSTILQSTPSYQDLRGSKIAIKWSSEGAKLFIDGVLNNTYIGDASLDIQYFGFDNPYNGDIVSTIKMKQLVGFPTALSDNECINLTTI